MEEDLSKIADREFYFLILHQLRSKLNDDQFQTLEESLQKQNLLPSRYDINGLEHQQKYGQVILEYKDIPQDSLLQMAKEVVTIKTLNTPFQGATSLLNPRAQEPLNVEALKTNIINGTYLPQSDQAGQSEKISSPYPIQRKIEVQQPFQVTSTTASQLDQQQEQKQNYDFDSKEQLQIRNKEKQNLFDQLQNRENFVNRRLSKPEKYLTPAMFSDRVTHQTSHRGHRYAVYCVSYDKTGSKIITGSDDCLIKIWNSYTGALLRTCRGHDGEITDFSVNATNELFASGSNDNNIRVWNLRDEHLGYPVATLSGHQRSVTFLDFHPVHPYALLSSSFDGTLRIWDITTTNEAHVFKPNPENFGTLHQNSHQLSYFTRHNLRGNVANIDRNVNATGMDGHLTQRQTRMRDNHIALVQRRGGQPQPAEEQAQEEGTEEEGLLCCLFSPDGKYIVVGSNKCNVYVYEWEYKYYKLAQRGYRMGRPKANEAKIIEPCIGELHENINEPITQLTFEGNREELNNQQHNQEQEVNIAQLNDNDQQDRGNQQAHLEQGEELEVQLTNNENAQGDGQENQPLNHRLQENNGIPKIAIHTGSYMKVEMALFRNVQDFQWDQPREICCFKGHKNDINLVEFNHSGNQLATASKDGTIRLFQKQIKDNTRNKYTWTEKIVLTCEDSDNARPQTQRQRRRPPNIQSVTQLSHSADDSKILVAINNFTIRVYDSHNGVLLHTLLGHDDAIHVVECNSKYPNLAFSAGYDGLIFLWNIEKGKMVKKFDSRDTYPCIGGRWPTIVQMCDGHFSPDGYSIVVSDVAGQFHVYGIGPGDLYRRSPWDQYFSSDYIAVEQDSRGFAFEPNSSNPAYTSYTRDLLVDYIEQPYEEPFQSARKSLKELFKLPLPSRLVGFKLPSALSNTPPTVTAALWKAEEQGQSANMPIILEEAHAEFRKQEDINDKARLYIEKYGPMDDEEVALERIMSSKAQLEMANMIQVDNQRGNGVIQITEDIFPQQRNDVTQLTGLQIGWHDIPARRRGEAIRGSPSVSEGSDYVQPDDVPHDVPIEMSESSGGEVEDLEEDQLNSTEDDDEEYNVRVNQNRALSRRQRQSHSRQSRRSRKRRQSGRGSQQVRRSSRRRGQDEDEGESDGDLPGPSRYQGLRSSRQTRGRRYNYDESELEEQVTEDEMGSAQIELSEVEGESESENETGLRSRGARISEATNQKSKAQQDTQYRDITKYSWLQQHTQFIGVYIPQCGDEVVYFKEGHDNFYKTTRNKRRTQPPGPDYLSERQRKLLRPATYGLITDINFYISTDNKDNTFAKVDLLITDPMSSHDNFKIEIDMPHPLSGYAEYLVLKSTFEKAMQRNWKVGENIKTPQLEDKSEDQQNSKNPHKASMKCEWWKAVIINDKLHNQVIEDPCAISLWERYLIEWEADEGESVAEDIAVSPWEMYYVEENPEEILAKLQQQSYLSQNSKLKDQILELIQESADNEYSVFYDTPKPRDKFQTYKDSPEKGDKYYYNTIIPLPLALADIQKRCENDYYRTLEAIKHDLNTIKSNAIEFHGPTAEFAETATLMVETFFSLFDGQPTHPAFIKLNEQNQQKSKSLQILEDKSGEFGTTQDGIQNNERTRLRKKSRNKIIDNQGDLQDIGEDEQPRAKRLRITVPGRQQSNEEQNQNQSWIQDQNINGNLNQQTNYNQTHQDLQNFGRTTRSQAQTQYNARQNQETNNQSDYNFISQNHQYETRRRQSSQHVQQQQQNQQQQSVPQQQVEQQQKPQQQQAAAQQQQQQMQPKSQQELQKQQFQAQQNLPLQQSFNQFQSTPIFLNSNGYILQQQQPQKLQDTPINVSSDYNLYNNFGNQNKMNSQIPTGNQLAQNGTNNQQQDVKIKRVSNFEADQPSNLLLNSNGNQYGSQFNFNQILNGQQNLESQLQLQNFLQNNGNNNQQAFLQGAQYNMQPIDLLIKQAQKNKQFSDLQTNQQQNNVEQLIKYLNYNYQNTNLTNEQQLQQIFQESNDSSNIFKYMELINQWYQSAQINAEQAKKLLHLHVAQNQLEVDENAIQYLLQQYNISEQNDQNGINSLQNMLTQQVSRGQRTPRKKGNG